MRIKSRLISHRIYLASWHLSSPDWYPSVYLASWHMNFWPPLSGPVWSPESQQKIFLATHNATSLNLVNNVKHYTSTTGSVSTCTTRIWLDCNYEEIRPQRIVFHSRHRMQPMLRAYGPVDWENTRLRLKTNMSPMQEQEAAINYCAGECPLIATKRRQKIKQIIRAERVHPLRSLQAKTLRRDHRPKVDNASSDVTDAIHNQQTSNRDGV